MEIINHSKLKLTDKENKYLTNIDNDVKMKTKLYSNNQAISYNTQGELIINDKCLTRKKDDKVEFNKCNKDKNQSWTLDNKKVYSSSSPDLCLFSQNETVELKKCSDDENSILNIEDSDTERTSDYVLKKYKGKTIVLVDSDNPWYLNKDTTIPMNFNNSFVTTTKKYRNNADYGNYKNNEFEHFNSETKKSKKIIENESISQNQIIFLLLIIVILLFVYKKSLNLFSKNK